MNLRSLQTTGPLRRGAVLMAALLGAAGLTAAPAWAAPARTAAPAAQTSVSPAAHLAGEPAFGPNVYVFTPSMPQSQIQATVDSIASQQISNQFGTQRYALLFEPGTYGSAADPLTFQVGYYTEVAGLGGSPGDVTINGSIDVYNQCLPAADGTNTNCIALDNFWRSMSNLTINVTGGTGCQAATDFWAVSQAAPMRRVAVNGKLSLMDYCNGGPDYASGGFIADSAFSGSTVINGSQQQFIVRNSNLDGWSNGVWNQVFSGDIGAPPTTFPPTATSGPYTTLATSPVTQEEPFLQTDASGNYSVFVPALQHNSSGTSWQSGPAAGTSVPISKFFIATPSTPVLAIDAALALGQNLLLAPGVYDLKAPILVSRPNTIVLGLGFPTLVPQNGTAAMQVLGVPGVKLSGMIFDAGPKNSPVLLQVGGPLAAATGSASDPALVQDVFFRIGGATAGLGHRQPRREQLPRHPGRHLGLARGPRRRRGVDQQHGRQRPDRQRQRRDRLRPGRGALPEERGRLERPGRRGHLLPERDALRPPEPGGLDVQPHDGRLSGLRHLPPGDQLYRVRPGQLLLLQPGRADRVGHRVPGA